jgi:hypothetical protein
MEHYKLGLVHALCACRTPPANDVRDKRAVAHGVCAMHGAECLRASILKNRSNTTHACNTMQRAGCGQAEILPNINAGNHQVCQLLTYHMHGLLGSIGILSAPPGVTPCTVTRGCPVVDTALCGKGGLSSVRMIIRTGSVIRQQPVLVHTMLSSGRWLTALMFNSEPTDNKPTTCRDCLHIHTRVQR